MTFPAIESTTTSTEASATTSHGVDMPATVNSGDLLVMIFVSTDNSTPAAASGWTQLGTINTSRVRCTVYYKSAAGTEGGTTVTLSTGAQSYTSAHAVQRITGWTGTPEISSGIQGSAGSIAGFDSVTPTWGADDTLFLACCGLGDDGPTADSYPGEYDLGRATARSSTTSNDGFTVATAARQCNAAADGASAIGVTYNGTTNYATLMVAVEPSVSGGGGSSGGSLFGGNLVRS